MSQSKRDDRIARVADEAASRPALFAAALRRFRTQEGLSEEELAERLGCDLPTLHKLSLCAQPQTEDALRYVGEVAGVDLMPYAARLLPPGLSPGEAAKVKGTTRATIHNAIKRGDLAAVRTAGGYRIDPDSLRALEIDRQRTNKRYRKD